MGNIPVSSMASRPSSWQKGEASEDNFSMQEYEGMDLGEAEASHPEGMHPKLESRTGECDLYGANESARKWGSFNALKAMCGKKNAKRMTDCYHDVQLLKQEEKGKGKGLLSLRKAHTFAVSKVQDTELMELQMESGYEMRSLEAVEIREKELLPKKSTLRNMSSYRRAKLRKCNKQGLKGIEEIRKGVLKFEKAKSKEMMRFCKVRNKERRKIASLQAASRKTAYLLKRAIDGQNKESNSSSKTALRLRAEISELRQSMAEMRREAAMLRRKIDEAYKTSVQSVRNTRKEYRDETIRLMVKHQKTGFFGRLASSSPSGRDILDDTNALVFAGLELYVTTETDSDGKTEMRISTSTLRQKLAHVQVRQLCGTWGDSREDDVTLSKSSEHQLEGRNGLERLLFRLPIDGTANLTNALEFGVLQREGACRDRPNLWDLCYKISDNVSGELPLSGQRGVTENQSYVNNVEDSLWDLLCTLRVELQDPAFIERMEGPNRLSAYVHSLMRVIQNTRCLTGITRRLMSNACELMASGLTRYGSLPVLLEYQAPFGEFDRLGQVALPPRRDVPFINHGLVNRTTANAGIERREAQATEHVAGFYGETTDDRDFNERNIQEGVAPCFSSDVLMHTDATIPVNSILYDVPVEEIDISRSPSLAHNNEGVMVRRAIFNIYRLGCRHMTDGTDGTDGFRPRLVPVAANGGTAYGGVETFGLGIRSAHATDVDYTATSERFIGLLDFLRKNPREVDPCIMMCLEHIARNSEYGNDENLAEHLFGNSAGIILEAIRGFCGFYYENAPTMDLRERRAIEGRMKMESPVCAVYEDMTSISAQEWAGRGKVCLSKHHDKIKDFKELRSVLRQLPEPTSSVLRNMELTLEYNSKGHGDRLFLSKPSSRKEEAATRDQEEIEDIDMLGHRNVLKTFGMFRSIVALCNERNIRALRWRERHKLCSLLNLMQNRLSNLNVPVFYSNNVRATERLQAIDSLLVEIGATHFLLGAEFTSSVAAARGVRTGNPFGRDYSLGQLSESFRDTGIEGTDKLLIDRDMEDLGRDEEDNLGCFEHHISEGIIGGDEVFDCDSVIASCTDDDKVFSESDRDVVHSSSGEDLTQRYTAREIVNVTASLGMYNHLSKKPHNLYLSISHAGLRRQGGPTIRDLVFVRKEDISKGHLSYSPEEERKLAQGLHMLLSQVSDYVACSKKHFIKAGMNPGIFPVIGKLLRDCPTAVHVIIQKDGNTNRSSIRDMDAMVRLQNLTEYEAEGEPHPVYMETYDRVYGAAATQKLYEEEGIDDDEMRDLDLYIRDQDKENVWELYHALSVKDKVYFRTCLDEMRDLVQSSHEGILSDKEKLNVQFMIVGRLLNMYISHKSSQQDETRDLYKTYEMNCLTEVIIGIRDHESMLDDSEEKPSFGEDLCNKIEYLGKMLNIDIPQTPNKTLLESMVQFFYSRYYPSDAYAGLSDEELLNNFNSMMHNYSYGTYEENHESYYKSKERFLEQKKELKELNTFYEAMYLGNMRWNDDMFYEASNKLLGGMRTSCEVQLKKQRHHEDLLRMLKPRMGGMMNTQAIQELGGYSETEIHEMEQLRQGELSVAIDREQYTDQFGTDSNIFIHTDDNNENTNVTPAELIAFAEDAVVLHNSDRDRGEFVGRYSITKRKNMDIEETERKLPIGSELFSPSTTRGHTREHLSLRASIAGMCGMVVAHETPEDICDDNDIVVSTCMNDVLLMYNLLNKIPQNGIRQRVLAHFPNTIGFAQTIDLRVYEDGEEPPLTEQSTRNIQLYMAAIRSVLIRLKDTEFDNTMEAMYSNSFPPWREIKQNIADGATRLLLCLPPGCMAIPDISTSYHIIMGMTSELQAQLVVAEEQEVDEDEPHQHSIQTEIDAMRGKSVTSVEAEVHYKGGCPLQVSRVYDSLGSVGSSTYVYDIPELPPRVNRLYYDLDRRIMRLSIPRHDTGNSRILDDHDDDSSIREGGDQGVLRQCMSKLRHVIRSLVHDKAHLPSAEAIDRCDRLGKVRLCKVSRSQGAADDAQLSLCTATALADSTYKYDDCSSCSIEAVTLLENNFDIIRDNVWHILTLQKEIMTSISQMNIPREEREKLQKDMDMLIRELLIIQKSIVDRFANVCVSQRLSFAEGDTPDDAGSRVRYELLRINSIFPMDIIGGHDEAPHTATMYNLDARMLANDVIITQQRNDDG